MKNLQHLSLYCIILLVLASAFAKAQSFSIDQISLYPFPSELVSSPTNDRIAWAFNEQGKRNVYVAQAPEFTPRKLTAFDLDDGQEISSLQFSHDGEWLLFVRGGEHGGWRAHMPINPASMPNTPKVEIWKAHFSDGNASVLAEGDDPKISINGDIAYIKNSQVWKVNVDGATPKQLFQTNGRVGDHQWSPDGSKLAFVANRSDHAFIGIYSHENTPIQWIAPAFKKDTSPRWSPDGSKILFVRLPGTSKEPKPILEQSPSPWQIWIADANTGEASMRWQSPLTMRGSVPSSHGGYNLQWAANDQIIYLSYENGWPQLYRMDAKSGKSTLLTKGEFMVEHVQMNSDGSKLIFSANTGKTADDIDRRHIGMVDIKAGDMKMLTQGEGIEAFPVFLANQQQIAYLSGTATRPVLPALLNLKKGTHQILGEKIIPAQFPKSGQVVPRHVRFKSSDGMMVYGQIFERTDLKGKKPGIVFVHGGPQRQMLLGWSYIDYYANTYAINQYLAHKGYVVLSVNYRLGTGYGYEFHKPPRTYWRGGEEYLDVKAAGEYLAALSQVDGSKIGIYGGSYGGYLTAMALARDSELFKVGVDIHGVHNLSGRFEMPDGYEKAPDYDEAVKTAWFSSPLADLDSWKSPVLIIHADDDRNVDFVQSTDLATKLEERGIPFEYLVIPDDTHHWMKFSNLQKVNQATVEFLERHLITSDK